MLDAEPNTSRAVEAAAASWRVSHQRSSHRQRTNPSAKNIRQAPMLPNPTISNAMRPADIADERERPRQANDHQERQDQHADHAIDEHGIGRAPPAALVARQQPYANRVAADGRRQRLIEKGRDEECSGTRWRPRTAARPASCSVGRSAATAARPTKICAIKIKTAAASQLYRGDRVAGRSGRNSRARRRNTSRTHETAAFSAKVSKFRIDPGSCGETDEYLCGSSCWRKSMMRRDGRSGKSGNFIAHSLIVPR